LLTAAFFLNHSQVTAPFFAFPISHFFAFANCLLIHLGIERWSFAIGYSPAFPFHSSFFISSPFLPLCLVAFMPVFTLQIYFIPKLGFQKW
jgi:hypothetical protein